MAALFAARRMVAHNESRMLDRFTAFDKTNREEHAAFLKAIQAVETQLDGRIATVETRLDDGSPAWANYAG